MRLALCVVMIGCAVGGGPIASYDGTLHLGVEGGGGYAAGPTGPVSVQLAGGWEPSAGYLRVDATNLFLAGNTNVDFSSTRLPGSGWRFGAGVAYDHGEIGVAGIAAAGRFVGLSDATRGSGRPCDSGRHPVMTVLAGARLVGKRLGFFLHPRIELQSCVLDH